jgi:hypothetical protein
MSDSDITLVTAFYDIGRENWEANFKRDVSFYIDSFLTYLDYDYKMICYIDDRYINKILEKYAESQYKNKLFIPINRNWLDENIPGICRTAGTGVDKINSLINFNCYPNPAQDYFTIDYTLQSPTNVCVRLYNYLGTEVLSLPQTLKNTGHHALKLETVTLSPGIYILKFDVGKSVISKKIVVLK